MLTCRIEERTLPLKRRFESSGWILHERRILLLKIMDSESGMSAVGEAAPMEEFGTESFDSAHEALRVFCAASHQAPDSIESLGVLLHASMEWEKTPTARFAVETAMLDLLGRIRNMPIHGLLGSDGPVAAVPVNAVIGAMPVGDVRSRGLELVENGFSCVKMKVGATRMEDDVERVFALREILGPEGLIRLDANGAWSVRLAMRFLDAAGDAGIEYLEQPVPAGDREALGFLTENSPVPIAADEAIRAPRDAMDILDSGAADVLVLKPMALGGLLPCIEIVNAARRAWKDVIFTSLLDGAVGRCAVAHLAAAVGGDSIRHHGLATGDLFVRDIAPDAVRFGQYFLPDADGLGLSPDA